MKNGSTVTVLLFARIEKLMSGGLAMFHLRHEGASPYVLKSRENDG
jgi:hypothetical protein